MTRSDFETGDCETDPFKHRRLPEPFIWGHFDGAMYQHFETWEQYYNFLRERKTIVYFHNGGKYDFHLGPLTVLNTHEKVTVINGRLVSAHIGECEIRDSLSLIPVALDQYKKTKIDYGIFEKTERTKTANRERIISYLGDDCRDLYNLITDFQAEMGKHLTLATAAMKSWERISKRKAPHSSKEWFYQFSEWYYGGRVQCFAKGELKGPFYVVDIHSAYPWAMLSKHPYGLEFTELTNPEDYKATSFVEIRAISRGALPWRNERGVMLFPNDNEVRTFKVTGHELIAGLETDTVKVIEFIKTYDFPDQLDFTPYIMHHYEQRQLAKMSGLKGKDIAHKLAMNALYGKFGANPDNYGNYMLVEFDEIEKIRDYEFEGMFGRFALMRAPLDEEQENYFNVATAASITGQVRAKLWRAICGSEGVIYCDTDCIFARETDVELGSAIGQWEKEGIAETAWLGGKKMYLLEGDFGIDKDTGKRKTIKRASKGVQISSSELKDVALGKIVEYKPQAPSFSLYRPPSIERSFPTRRVRSTVAL